jgi:plasmid replication initiation protein
MILKKYSLLTQCSGDLTLNDRKIFNYLLYIRQTQNSTNQIYITSIGKIKKFLQIKHNNRGINQSLKNLTDKEITTNILHKEKDKQQQTFKIISYLKNNEDYSIEFRFNEEIEKMTTANNIYSNLNLKDTHYFKSKYSLILYELLNDYKRISKLPTITIEDFLKIMGSKYDNFSLINEKILKPSLNEINQKTVFQLNYETTRYGRKIKLIDFKFSDITKNKKFKAFKEFMLKRHNNLEIKTKTQTIIVNDKMSVPKWKALYLNRERFKNVIALKEFEIYNRHR